MHVTVDTHGCVAGSAAAGVALALTCFVHAQDKFPSRPIELIVPTPPGGGVDIVARMLAELAEPILGAKLVVVNKPGGTGAIGVTQLTQAKPDGYTLAVVWNAPLTVTPIRWRSATRWTTTRRSRN